MRQIYKEGELNVGDDIYILEDNKIRKFKVTDIVTSYSESIFSPKILTDISFFINGYNFEENKVLYNSDSFRFFPEKRIWGKTKEELLTRLQSR